MGPGDMRFRNLTSSALPGGDPLRRESLRRAPKLIAFTLMLLGAVLLLWAATGLAKEKKPQTRTVIGVVTDDAENPIEGAAVELADRQTGKVLDIYSQDGGHYQYTDLRFDHDYTVKATYQGASSEVRQASSLDTRTPLVLNLTIPKPNK
jgi:hypothetical protein